VQPFLRKIFEGIQSLDFKPDQLVWQEWPAAAAAGAEGPPEIAGGLAGCGHEGQAAAALGWAGLGSQAPGQQGAEPAQSRVQQSAVAVVAEVASSPSPPATPPQVTAMVSEEGERVAFAKPFNPKAAGGAVERWLGDCESSMRATLLEVLKASSQAYAAGRRVEWMLQWPGQVVLCVGSAFWTREVEEAIGAGTLGQYAGAPGSTQRCSMPAPAQLPVPCSTLNPAVGRAAQAQPHCLTTRPGCPPPLARALHL
jgi:hypothetical protein